MSESPLDPFYYLSNFESVLASLRDRYADLLSAEEGAFMACFAAMPRASRALLVRMAMRKGDLFRASRLTYHEIGATGTAVAPLLEAGWVDATPSLSLDELERLLTKGELAQYFSLPWRDRSRRKAELVESLRTAACGLQPFQGSRMGSRDCVYRLRAAALLERLRFMFFGNFRQDWSEFVLADLGIFTYEKIESPLQCRAFRSRADIEVFEQLHRCQELLHSGAPLDSIVQCLPPCITDGGWLEERRQRLLFQVGRRCERDGDLAAEAVYAGCSHRQARVRLIRLRERGSRFEAARTLCLTALNAPEDAAEQQQLARILPRLNKKLGMKAADAAPKKQAAALPCFELELDRAVSERAVEWQVRDFLTRQMPEATAHYVENSLVTSLFGLLCWNAIFAPVAGAFFHDFHRGPADLSSAQFSRRRERQFSECLAQLDSRQYACTIRETYAKKMHVQSPFVKWNMLSEFLLERALECFPAQHLKRWFEWIVRDVQLNRTGFPDLVQFWPKERRYRLVEVKGPGDRLQDNQRRLLELCAAHEMPVSLCKVRWNAAQ